MTPPADAPVPKTERRWTLHSWPDDLSTPSNACEDGDACDYREMHIVVHDSAECAERERAMKAEVDSVAGWIGERVNMEAEIAALQARLGILESAQEDGGVEALCWAVTNSRELAARLEVSDALLETASRQGREKQGTIDALAAKLEASEKAWRDLESQLRIAHAEAEDREGTHDALLRHCNQVLLPERERLASRLKEAEAIMRVVQHWYPGQPNPITAFLASAPGGRTTSG